MLKYKVILAGSKNVGKSSLIARFCDNIFDENMKGTIGVAFKRKKILLNSDQKEISLELNIWDFGGEEKYRMLFPSYANGATAALILYDTTNRETIADIASWVKIVDENAYEGVIKILIGTKIDLTEKREITKEEATKTCEKYRWCAETIETSAKTGENVEEAFLNVAREILKRKLHTCKNCGEVFDKKLKFCQYCGDKVKVKIV